MVQPTINSQSNCFVQNTYIGLDLGLDGSYLLLLLFLAVQVKSLLISRGATFESEFHDDETQTKYPLPSSEL